jgi:hypothetical protein
MEARATKTTTKAQMTDTTTTAMAIVNYSVQLVVAGLFLEPNNKQSTQFHYSVLVYGAKINKNRAPMNGVCIGQKGPSLLL